MASGFSLVSVKKSSCLTLLALNSLQNCFQQTPEESPLNVESLQLRGSGAGKTLDPRILKRFGTFYQHAASTARKTGISSFRGKTTVTERPPLGGFTTRSMRKDTGVAEEDKAQREDTAPAPEDTASPGSGNVAENPVTPDEKAAPGTAATASTSDGDELPEHEELTPELVEEEAIRGDFMLRWAAIFLAVLFGFSQISDSRVLVHIRSGDDMRANGFLPASADRLSYALDNESVSNVGWLFDHLVSAIYGAGGETGLTIFKAFIAGLIAYVLSLISIRGMPTWWNSICCVLAVTACSVDFIPVTDLATLVGLSLILLQLHRYSDGSATGLTWKIPLIIAVWANFDPHAYMGVLAVGLFALGSHLQRSRSKADGDGTAAETSVLWKCVGFGAIALLVNPSPLASLTSVVTTYTVHYPTMNQISPLTDSNGGPLLPAVVLDGRTEYFPIWAAELLNGFELAWVAGLALIAFAVVVLLIARSREDLPWGILFVGFALMAMLALHEMPAAALAAAVAASTSAQRWYGRKFRQEYTINPSEVLFSRGGRAITVLAFAALSFFVVADRLPTRAPIGIGFEANMKTTMETLGEQFKELPEGALVMHTVMSQGDMLIWHGQQSFIDSRIVPFGSYAAEDSPVRKFDTFRWSIIRPSATADTAADAAADTESPEEASGAERPFDPEWKEHIAEMGVTHAMIRLSPPGRPAYTMAASLFQSRDWNMTSRGASALLFGLITDQDNPPKSVSSTRIAFRDSEAQDLEQVEFARPKDFYQKYLYASRSPMGGAMRQAQHYLNIDCRFPDATIFQVARAAASEPDNSEMQALLGTILAGPVLAIRNANKAIFEDPQNAAAHRVRGTAYQRMFQTEGNVAAGMGGGSPRDLRYMQSVMALRQAATIEPDVAATWQQLMSLYQSNNRTDLANECLTNLLALEEERLLKIPDAEPQLRQYYELQRTWNERTETIQTQVNEILEQETIEDPQQLAQQRFALVQQLAEEGQILMALKICKDNLDLLRAIPQCELLRGRMLLEAGELEDGALVLNQLAAVIGENPNHPGFAGLAWHLNVALSRMARADYPGAADIWAEQLRIINEIQRSPQLAESTMRGLPLVPAVESGIGGEFTAWPLSHLQAAQIAMTAVPASQYEPSLLRALAEIESGNVANARFILEGLVSEGGEHEYRPLASAYLRQLSDDAAELIADSSIDPWEDFEFPEIESDTTPANKDTEEVKAEEDAS